MDKQRVVIIGAVALGPKVACRLKRLRPDLEVIRVDQDEHISYGGCGIPYYISGDVSDVKELMSTSFHMLRDPKFFEDAKDVRVRTRTRAFAIDRQARTVLLESLETGQKEQLSYDQLVLATGSKVVQAAPARSATTTGEPSWPTRNVLFERGPFDAFAAEPEAALAELHRFTVGAEGDPDVLFALAELSFLHGRAAKKPDYSLAAPVYAYAFLFPEGVGTAPGRFDPRLRIPAGLYNWAPAAGFASKDRLEVVPQGGTFALPFGHIEVAFDPAALRAGDREPYRFIPVSELEDLRRRRPAGMLAEAGSVPAGLPVTVDVREPRGPRTWRFRVAEAPLLVSFLVTYVTNASLTAQAVAAGDASARLVLDLALADGRTVHLEQIASSPDALARVASFAGAAAGFLAGSPFPHPAITNVRVAVERSEALSGAQIVAAVPARNWVRPGERLPVAVRVVRHLRPAVEITVTVDVPAGHDAGPLDLVVADGASWGEYRQRTEGPAALDFDGQLAQLALFENRVRTWSPRSNSATAGSPPQAAPSRACRRRGRPPWRSGSARATCGDWRARWSPPPARRWRSP